MVLLEKNLLANAGNAEDVGTPEALVLSLICICELLSTLALDPRLATLKKAELAF